MTQARDKAVLVKLKISSWGGYKTDKQTSREVALGKNASKTDAGSYIKKLLGKGEAGQIGRIKNKALSYYQSISLPWEDTGYRILPTALFMEFSENVRKFKSDFQIAKRNFISDLPKIKESGRLRLGDLYREEDYPTIGELERKIHFSTTLMPLPGSSDFRLDLPEEEAEAIKREAKKAEKEMAAGIIRECCKKMYEPLKNIIEKVKEFDDKWQESSLKKLGTIAQIIRKLNIVDDPEINHIAHKISSDIVSHHPFDIKHRPSTRNVVIKSGEELLSTMEGIM